MTCCFWLTIPGHSLLLFSPPVGGVSRGKSIVSRVGLSVGGLQLTRQFVVFAESARLSFSGEDREKWFAKVRVCFSFAQFSITTG